MAKTVPRPRFTLVLDESGDHGFPGAPRVKKARILSTGAAPAAPLGSGVLVLGGPVVSTDLLLGYSREVIRIFGDCAKTSNPSRRSDLMNGKPPFAHIRPENVPATSGQILERLATLEFSYIAGCCDKLAHKAQYGNNRVDEFLPSDFYLLLLTFVAERFVNLLEEADGQGVILLEKRGRSEDQKVEDLYERLLVRGTAFVSGDRFRSRLASIPSWCDKQIPERGAVLVADWFDWALARWTAGSPYDKSELEFLKERIWRSMSPATPGGLGLKTWPDRRGREWLGQPRDDSLKKPTRARD